MVFKRFLSANTVQKVSQIWDKVGEKSAREIGKLI